MSVPLTPAFERAVTERVRRGMYGSVEQVLHAMERALEQQELEAADNLEALRLAVSVGVEEGDRGELIYGDEVFARIRAARNATAV